MSNQLTIPASFQNAQALAALDPSWQEKSAFSAGIRRGFAVMSIRGKVWRVQHQGESRPVTSPGTQHPAPFVDVVLVDATPGLSKVYYSGAYVEGSDEAPACFSHDGVKPDSSVQTPQASACSLCPHNVWGSKVTENGKQTKACADSKRVAILPAAHESSDEATKLSLLQNDALGGPMLLRIPAATMTDLATFDAQMGQMGFKLHAMVTRMSFDIETAYPKIKFEPVRPLTVAEFQKILDWRASAQVRDMLNSAAPEAATPVAPQGAAPAQAQVREPAVQLGTSTPVATAGMMAPAEPVSEAVKARRPRPAKVETPAPAQAPAQAPTQAPVGGMAFGGVPVAAPVTSTVAQDVDSLLDDLLG
jgi:hypothetical protein